MLIMVMSMAGGIIGPFCPESKLAAVIASWCVLFCWGLFDCPIVCVSKVFLSFFFLFA